MGRVLAPQVSGFGGHRERLRRPLSIEVNRRRRRAKIDRLDVVKLLDMLLRHDRGEKVWSVVEGSSSRLCDCGMGAVFRHGCSRRCFGSGIDWSSCEPRSGTWSRLGERRSRSQEPGWNSGPEICSDSGPLARTPAGPCPPSSSDGGSSTTASRWGRRPGWLPPRTPAAPGSGNSGSPRPVTQPGASPHSTQGLDLWSRQVKQHPVLPPAAHWGKVTETDHDQRPRQHDHTPPPSQDQEPQARRRRQRHVREVQKPLPMASLKAGTGPSPSNSQSKTPKVTPNRTANRTIIFIG